MWPRPINGGTGKIYGLETRRSVCVRTLGLGFQANYTRARFIVHANQFRSALSCRFPGVSKNSVNGTVYFERAGFFGTRSLHLARQSG